MNLETRTANIHVVAGGVNTQLTLEFTNGSTVTLPFYDPSFGSGGIVTTQCGITPCAGANDVAIQSDGKIVAVGGGNGSFAVFRYNVSGSLDTTFGAGGKAITPMGNRHDAASAVDIQTNGKIVVAGFITNGTDEDFAVVRYNANGSLDGTFGTGGKVVTDFGGSFDEAHDVKVQPDGKIVVVGMGDGPPNLKFALARYNSDGTLDNTFGAGGKVTTPLSFDARAFAAALQGDGKIVVAGYAGGFAIARYNSDGTLDSSFATGGVVVLETNSQANDVSIQPDGKIVAAGGIGGSSSTSGFYLARVNADGLLDQSFGSSGTVITLFGEFTDPVANGVALQSDGKIVAAGFSRNNGYRDFAVVRYDVDGSLDTTFGTDGRILTATGTGEDDGRAIAIQPDGRIVVAGYTVDANGTNLDFAVVRYLPTPFSAGIFTVTRSDDRNSASCTPGDCSLREAINAANALQTNDIINFAGLTTITMSANVGEMVINDAGTLVINGPGANVLTIDGGAGGNRIFFTNLATATISGMTLTGGDGGGAFSNFAGGAILARGGGLTLDRVHVTGNSVPVGSGGGVLFTETSGNHRIIDSTLSGNTAQSCAGFSINNGTLTVSNSTISGNTASSIGGGFCNSGNTTLRNVTVTNNSAINGTSGGINQSGGGSLNFGNTIVARNTAPSRPDIYFGNGLLTSAGNNLIGDSMNTENVITYQPTDIRDVNPMLGPLQNNGGRTPTHALLAGSPAIDKGGSFGASADQRGFTRPVDDSAIPNVSNGSDIGAFELGPTSSTQTSTGQNVNVAPITNLTLNFGNVTAGGTTSATLLSPSQVEPLPANFALIGSPIMYNITTSATFSGNIAVTFVVPNVGNALTCSQLRILHYVNNDWDISNNAAPVYNSGAQTCTVSQTVSSLSPFVVVQYIGQTHILSGQVTNGGDGLSGVTVGLSGTIVNSAVTDSSGSYSFTVDRGGDYTVTPALANYGFTPAARSFNNVAGDQTADFSAASTCTYSISPAAASVVSGGGSGSVTVAAPSGCGWTAESSAAWLTVTSGAAGGGNGTVNYSAAANDGAGRSATIAIGGQTLTVDQAAGTFDISGTVSYGTTPAGQPARFVPGVNLGASGAVPANASSGTTGGYLLSGLSSGSYTVTASKTAQTSNSGISLQDASEAAKIAFNQITATTNQRTAADATGNGSVSLQDASEIAKRAFNIPSTNIVGNWKFAPASRSYAGLSANLSGENFEAVLVGDVTGNWTAPPPPESRPESEQVRSHRSDSGKGKALEIQNAVAGGGIPVTITNTSAIPGATVLVPIEVGNLTGQGITSYDLTVSFDPAILQPASPAFDTSATLTGNAGGYSVFVDPTLPLGQLRVGAFGTTPLTGAGTLIFLRFIVQPGDTALSQINFVEFKFGEDGIPASTTTGGRFRRLGPTAAAVSVSGRVMTADGRGIGNVRLTLQNSGGNTRTAMTSSFGYYRFDDVAAGETYVLTATAKRIRFSQPSQVLNLADSAVDVNFIGN